jgi:hypothetical protein
MMGFLAQGVRRAKPVGSFVPIGASLDRPPSGGDIFSEPLRRIAAAEKSGGTRKHEQAENRDGPIFAHRTLLGYI